MRYIGPKRRLSRREGMPLFRKDEKALQRKGAVPPGFRGTKIRSRITSYGIQLRAKQKAKRLYGLSERQFHKTYKQAAAKKGAIGESMLVLLETRLDNIIYRLGFARSRMEARQMVTHGHIRVDEQRVNIPSFPVQVNQVVAISPNFVHNTQIAKNLGEDLIVPKWLEKKAASAKLIRLPNRDEMEQSVEEQLIIEYYSR